MELLEALLGWSVTKEIWLAWIENVWITLSPYLINWAMLPYYQQDAVGSSLRVRIAYKLAFMMPQPCDLPPYLPFYDLPL